MAKASDLIVQRVLAVCLVNAFQENKSIFVEK
jgi:hypothetical protein